MRTSGRVVSVDSEVMGSELVADAAATDTEIYLENVEDFFDESGGTLTITDIDGVTTEAANYIGRDDVTAKLLLDAGLANAYSTEARVVLTGEVTDLVAYVKLDEDDDSEDGYGVDGEPIRCLVHHSLRDKLAEGQRDDGAGETVELEYDDDDLEWWLINITGVVPVIDATMIDTYVATVEKIVTIDQDHFAPDGVNATRDEAESAPDTYQFIKMVDGSTARASVIFDMPSDYMPDQPLYARFVFTFGSNVGTRVARMLLANGVSHLIVPTGLSETATDENAEVNAHVVTKTDWIALDTPTAISLDAGITYKLHLSAGRAGGNANDTCGVNLRFLGVEVKYLAPPAVGGPPGADGTGSTVIVQEDDAAVATVGTLDFQRGFDVSESPAGEVNISLDLSEGVPVYYESGSGAAISDADFASAPADGTVAVAHNTATGLSYLWVRANGAWKSVEVS